MHPQHPMNPSHRLTHQGPIWRRGQQDQPQGRGPWAGYGLKPPAPGQQGNVEAIEGCIQAYADMAASQVQVSDLAPWIHPPYRGKRFCEYKKVVLSTTAAVDPVTNAAGIALAAALNSVVPNTVQLIEMQSATGWVELWSFRTVRSTEAYFESWGISQENHVDEALSVGLEGATAGGLPTPPNPSLGAPPTEFHEPANFMTPEDALFKVRVRLLDLTTPLIVSFGVCYWTYPVTNRRDDRDRNATNLRTGYGPDCNPR